MLCGGSAGIVFWSCIFWIDLIKTKLQSDSLTNPRYKSNYDCLYQTLKESGIRGLYRGIVPALLRAFPVSAAYVAGFESAMSFLGRDQK